MAVSDLAAPGVLLAMPQVVDPFFRKSVVLLLAHESEGSFGFVVNRRTELKVGDILRDLELVWSGDPDLRARFGGPVQPQVGSVLFHPAPAGGPQLPGSSEVVLDGKALQFGDPDGFRMKDRRHLEVAGEACERLRATGKRLSVRISCQ